MAWRENCIMDERLRFVLECLSDEESMSSLCSAYGISRKTGYKWLSRYRGEGAGGLMDRSRAPLVHGRSTPARIVDHVLTVKNRHPDWGPRKIVAWLSRKDENTPWPSASTAGVLLKRHGLVQARGRRRWRAFGTGPFEEVDRPNAVWSADHKGWFRTQDGLQCYPLTIMDARTRYLLKVSACQTTGDLQAWPEFRRAFEEYGLPDRIRSDNGPPFASASVTGLTPLAVRLLKLGIDLERIDPGKPQQNGGHERMHLTLQHVTARPAANRQDQQKAFETFRQVYNQERPHEGLNMDTPASRYRPSSRPMPDHIPEPLYPAQLETRRVRPNGSIKWNGREIYISSTLAGERVALEERDDRQWAALFATYPLGIVDLKNATLTPHPRARKVVVIPENV